MSEGLGVTRRAPAGQLDRNAFPGRPGAMLVTARSSYSKCRIEVLNSEVIKPLLRLTAKRYYKRVGKVCKLGQEVALSACA